MYPIVWTLYSIAIVQIFTLDIKIKSLIKKLLTGNLWNCSCLMNSSFMENSIFCSVFCFVFCCNYIYFFEKPNWYATKLLWIIKSDLLLCKDVIYENFNLSVKTCGSQIYWKSSPSFNSRSKTWFNIGIISKHILKYVNMTNPYWLWC